MVQEKKALLALDDGSVFEGISFGYEKSVAGEIVFNTAMVGYPESLTDPSYKGQILTVTYPLVGNYGVPANLIKNSLSEFYESEHIHVSALIISDYSHEYSHWNANKSLGNWLKEEQIPGLYGIDTRELTKLIREKGTMNAKIVFENETVDFIDTEKENQVANVSCTEVITYGNGENKVVLIDCGVKHNIIRSLLHRDVTLYRVPWNYDFSQLDYDGLFISNGPGDPSHCVETIEHIAKALTENKPIFGICMGNQLLAKAAGAETYKLKYGHRSHNQPVRMNGTNKCFITSQNHGYAVNEKGLDNNWKPLFTNMNDNTNEGIRHISKPFYSAQFHPEASSGPTDTDFFFDMFIDSMNKV